MPADETVIVRYTVDDVAAAIGRLTSEGVRFRNDIVAGPAGKQVLALDPAGNLIELFQPAAG